MFLSNEQGLKLSGIYRGIVKKHLPHGRCKVFIYGVYSDNLIDKPECLPDCEQAACLFGGSNNGNGVFSYPNIGATVWCRFENEDQNKPVYFASSLGGENAFGQYEIVMPPRYKEGSDLSSTSETEVVSNKHLITAGSAQTEFYESGIISSYVSYPCRNDSQVERVNGNTYQLERIDDHVKSRPVWEQIEKEEIENANCQHVLDNKTEQGLIKSSTHYFEPEKNVHIDTYDKASNNLQDPYKELSVVKTQKSDEYSGSNVLTMKPGVLKNTNSLKTGSDDASTTFILNSRQNSGVTMKSIDNSGKSNYSNVVDTKSGKHDIKLNDLDKANDFVQTAVEKSGKLTLTVSNDARGTVSKITIDSVSGQININITGSGGNCDATFTDAGIASVKTSDQINLESTNSISIKSKDIKINGDSTVNVEGGSSVDVKSSAIGVKGSSTVDINGPGGDCVISTVSLTKHIHPYAVHSGITMPPL